MLRDGATGGTRPRQRWFGIGSSATLNEEPIRTSEKTALGEAILYTSALEQFDRARHERFDALTAKMAANADLHRAAVEILSRLG
ncbi:hypothetical protein IB277_20260 [Ensifer sp. ENS07]|uniref:hypothetical protein n=1 Tax=Ensifer TaxID=106591 RepID=UPI000DDCF27A|nr:MULTISPECIES: hypothetical protein [Ensifer]MBD9638640.1 hypothetical protein [Ensifer sp. ENS07]MBW0370754.1 hypothetical protein [Ensifer adhaerens]